MKNISTAEVQPLQLTPLDGSRSFTTYITERLLQRGSASLKAQLFFWVLHHQRLIKYLFCESKDESLVRPLVYSF